MSCPYAVHASPTRLSTRSERCAELMPKPVHGEFRQLYTTHCRRQFGRPCRYRESCAWRPYHSPSYSFAGHSHRMLKFAHPSLRRLRADHASRTFGWNSCSDGVVVPKSFSDLRGLVLANLRIDFLSMRARVGPSVHQILGTEIRVCSEQGLLAGAYAPGLFKKPNGNPGSNDTRLTTAHIRTRVDTWKIVIKLPNHPLEDSAPSPHVTKPATFSQNRSSSPWFSSINCR